MIKKYDFSEVDYLDPSLLSGHRVIYDRNILTRIKYIDKYNSFINQIRFM